jgi:hypothetical protein
MFSKPFVPTMFFHKPNQTRLVLKTTPNNQQISATHNVRNKTPEQSLKRWHTSQNHSNQTNEGFNQCLQPMWYPSKTHQGSQTAVYLIKPFETLY